MIKLTSTELREKWIKFFVANDHYYMESKSLIPKNDPSLLFINSGVATLKDYFSCKLVAPSPRIVNCQKVIRTNDIENIGITSRHHTFFEMLGNFSFGDYFKDHSVKLAHDFLINELKMDINKLYVTVFEEDDAAYQAWIKLNFPSERIFKKSKADNFWDTGLGPCGSCSEIFYDRGTIFHQTNQGINLLIDNVENDRYIEIWNIVFSEFNNDGNQNYELLKQKNIDTGAGFERLLAISQDVPTNFDTDLFQGIIAAVIKNSKMQYQITAYFNKNQQQKENNKILIIISDHLRAIVMALSDGIIFSQKQGGYILRRLFRRILGLGKIYDLKEDFFLLGAQAVIDSLGGFYSNLSLEAKNIITALLTEAKLFEYTLSKAWNQWEKVQNKQIANTIPAIDIFKLIETFGFPKDLLDELMKKNNLYYDRAKYLTLFKQHQNSSRQIKKHAAMAHQNANLINFKTPCIFNYFDIEYLDAKIIGLFNDKLEPVEYLNNEAGYLILNKTCLYAESGGQEADYGWIDGFFSTYSFKGPNKQHFHAITSGSFNLNQTVKVVLDFKRRQQLQRQHSSEHLLSSALRKLISREIKQAGAYKGIEKITFDFYYHQPLTTEQITQLEEQVNIDINTNYQTEITFVDLVTANALNAQALFKDTYLKHNDKLRLVKLTTNSLELCAGTHVEATGDIQEFIIIDFESNGSNLWRITALSGANMIKEYFKTEKIKLNKEIKDLAKEWVNFLPLWDNYSDSINVKNITVLRYWKKELLSLKKKLIEIKKQHFIQLEKQQINELKTLIINTLKQTDKLKVFTNHNYNTKIINNFLSYFLKKQENYYLLILSPNQANYQYHFIAHKELWKSDNKDANLLSTSLKDTFDASGGGNLQMILGSIKNKYSKKEIINFFINFIK